MSATAIVVTVLAALAFPLLWAIGRGVTAVAARAPASAGRPRQAARGGQSSRVAAGQASAAGPILKPLPPQWFYVYESATIGANAEMRWEVMKDKGYLVPAENFYVRDHTSTPLIDARTWQLKVFGSGLRGAPGIGSAVTFSYEDLLGMPLLPDHGFPLRFICPSWIGVANVKWVGQIEVSATPLFSYWNTLAYRLFGPTYPAAGTLITRQVVKSSFELEWNATLPARPSLLTGRSWSGNGRIAYTEVSTDGPTWQRARPRDRGLPHAWQRWEIPWQPPGPGAYTLRARATDVTGATQPATVPFNTREYLFDGIVDHHVTVT